MTALNLSGFDDGEPTLEVWEIRTRADGERWYATFLKQGDGWYWHDKSVGDDSGGPFASRDLALADAARCGADTREENIV